MALAPLLALVWWSGAGGASPTLSPPKTSAAQDTKFFTEVGEGDSKLASYELTEGNTALRALLTAGTGFCALLKLGGGLDAALVNEAVGVRSQEPKTKLPLSVTTFNTIESVALLALCPGEEKLVPAATRAKIRHLGQQLAKHAD
jgi:hypothetical protein